MQDSRTHRTLLVAIDGSAEAQHASERAILLARDLGATLYVLFVVDTHAARSTGIYFHEAVREMTQASGVALDPVVQRAKELGVNAEGLVEEGRPGEQICRTAAERRVDILVIGARGRSAVSEVLLGSVSQYVLHHAECPVLLVRGHA